MPCNVWWRKSVIVYYRTLSRLWGLEKGFAAVDLALGAEVVICTAEGISCKKAVQKWEFIFDPI